MSPATIRSKQLRDGAAVIEQLTWHGPQHPNGNLTGNLVGTDCQSERQRLGITQELVAAVAGVSVRCLRMFERGQVTPYANTVKAICGALSRFAREQAAERRSVVRRAA